jgi:dihydroorotate dehydrogenase (fumarate)
LRQVRNAVANWLELNEFESLSQMQGSMSLLRCADPGAYQRANYVRLLQSWHVG